MKYILNLLAAIFSFSAIAQTTITSTDFIIAGDTVGVSTTADLSIDFQTTGQNSTWDYSNLMENSQLFEIAYDISTAGMVVEFQFGNFAPPQYQASFYQPFDGLPLDQLGGILPVSIESINRLTKIENDKVTYLGYSLEVDGQQVGFRSDTIETAYVFPLNYGDNYSSRGYTNMDFNPVFDAQFIQYRQRDSNVDGEGQLITPFGTYNTIRIHHHITELDSVRVNLGGFNQWFPINRTISEYEWWDNNLKRPVLKIETEGAMGSETPTRVTFLNHQLADLPKNSIEVAVYPNPSSDFINIQSKEIIQKINVLSSTGKIVNSFVLNSSSISIDLQDLAPGMYTLQSITQNGQSFNPIVIK